MSERELRRAAVLAQVKSQAWTLVEAAERMGLSYRQAKRLWKSYQGRGAAGLAHGNVGRDSNRAKPKKVRAKALRLIRQKYSGKIGERFGPTLAAEHLESEDGLELSATTIRRWMLAEGLWSRSRKVRQHRQRRERRAHFGELVQLDGSFHDWLEQRGPNNAAQYVALRIADDVAYGTGAWLGAVEQRSGGALAPKFTSWPGRTRG